MSSNKQQSSSYDAFASVDSLVSKPVLGSDGAASWQEFQSNSKTISRGVAPHMPVKRADRLSTGMKTIHDERKREQKIRQKSGEIGMGSGYTVFKRKGDQNEALEKKRRKMIEQRKRPDDKKYFIKSQSGTFEGWKEDYIFTTRDRGTGYYWDGTDSIKKLYAEEIVEEGVATNVRIVAEEEEVKPKKKKSKDGASKKKSKKGKKNDELPKGWETALDPFTGKAYFYNVTLNKTVWERHEVESSSDDNEGDISGKGDDELPSGWKSAQDPTSGKTYFYNVSLNKTVWDRPTK